MPVTPTNCKVTWPDGTTTTYDIPDDSTLVKGDVVVKFKGRKNGTQDAAHDIEITRSQTRTIEYGV